MEYRKKERGWNYSVHYAKDAKGRYPINEFWKSLHSTEERLVKAYLFLVAEGKKVPRERFKKLRGSDGIWEIKVITKDRHYRIYCFIHGDRLVLTHGGMKIEQSKKFQREIRFAEKLKKLYKE